MCAIVSGRERQGRLVKRKSYAGLYFRPLRTLIGEDEVSFEGSRVECSRLTLMF